MTGRERATAAAEMVGHGVEAYELPKREWQFSRVADDGTLSWCYASMEFIEAEWCTVGDLALAIRKMLGLDGRDMGDVDHSSPPSGSGRTGGD